MGVNNALKPVQRAFCPTDFPSILGSKTQRTNARSDLARLQMSMKNDSAQVKEKQLIPKPLALQPQSIDRLVVDPFTIQSKVHAYEKPGHQHLATAADTRPAPFAKMNSAVLEKETIVGGMDKTMKIPKSLLPLKFDPLYQFTKTVKPQEFAAPRSVLTGYQTQGASYKLPPDLSQINLEQTYWDLVHQSDALRAHYSKPNTNQDIVSVIFVRHGQSTMNKDGVFQGWVDAPLSEQGQRECKDAGVLLKNLGYKFDVAYTSLLCRATDTTDILLDEMGLSDHTHVHKTWRLNERHYGHLQGKSKQKTVDEFGKEQVKLWRQSYDDPPPEIDYDHPDHPRFDELYKGLSEEDYKQMPVGESLKMVRQRVKSYWKEQIFPTLENMGGKQILFSTHKHVLRAMVLYLAELDEKQIPKLIIPNASPFVFEFDKSQDYKIVRNYYIDDETTTVFENQKEDEAGLQ